MTEENDGLPELVQFEETDSTYRDILAKARSRTEELAMFHSKRTISRKRSCASS